MIAAAVFTAFALQAIGSPAPAPSPSVNEHPCAPTIVEALDKRLGANRRAPGLETTTYRGYGFAFFGLKDSGLGFSAWFQRRGNTWCVLETAGDAIDIPDAEKFGVPRRIAERLVDQFETALHHRPR